ncbi:MAG: hypothetical protein HYW51_02680 [Candidatus Doudnabacteria bacterium]|nr:hypothetical protein [Candidatus Doudnabacteria bacterium]
MWGTIDVIVIKGLIGASILFPFVWALAFVLDADKVVARRFQQWVDGRHGTRKAMPFRDAA